MKRPRLLDLFCGAGGAAMGYHRAGFDVVGVDIKPQPHYPFEFIQADALDLLTYPYHYTRGLSIDAVHASPPCQAFSTIAKQIRSRRLGQYDHPDLIEPTRRILRETHLPYVMENVRGAPFTTWFQLCGSSFGLDLRRHRIFETGGGFDPLMVPPCAHGWQTPRFRSLDKRRLNVSPVVSVHGTGRHYALATVVGVHGHINYAGERELRERAMGIDWMSPEELAEAIPPAYTEWIGAQLLAAIEAAA